ncbi:MAG: hypothetical protein ACP5TY_03020 [Thermodesulforhabdaceae bacterium]|jgi:hypothetical protein
MNTEERAKKRRRIEDMFVRPGTYIIEEAFIITADTPRRGIILKDAFLDVEDDGKRLIVHGRATVHNLSLVELYEDHDKLDMIINMGDGFKFYLKEPIIQAGKVFSPAIESTMRFIPVDSFDLMTDDEYRLLVKSVTIINKNRACSKFT